MIHHAHLCIIYSQQKKLINDIEKYGSWAEKMWLPLLRLAHKRTAKRMGGFR